MTNKHQRQTLNKQKRPDEETRNTRPKWWKTGEIRTTGFKGTQYTREYKFLKWNGDWALHWGQYLFHNTEHRTSSKDNLEITWKEVNGIKHRYKSKPTLKKQ